MSFISAIVALLHIIIITQIGAVLAEVALFSAIVAFDVRSVAGWAILAEMTLFSAVEALILVASHIVPMAGLVVVHIVIVVVVEIG